MKAQTENITAADAYVTAHEDFSAKLAAAEAALEAHMDSTSPESVHWGHVGDLRRAVAAMDEVLNALEAGPDC